MPTRLEVGGERYVIFDLYGTLVDWNYTIGSFISFHVSPRVVSKYFECDIREVSTYRPYKEVLKKCLLEVAKSERLEISEELLSSFVLAFAKSPPFPDAIYGIRLIRGQGFKTCVLSNTDRDLIEITLCGIKGLFDCIITAEDIKYYKPLKEAFLKAYELLSISPEQAIHVSAYPQYDLVPASNLGATTVLVDRGLGYTWSTTVKDLRELIYILRQLVQHK